MEVRFGRKETMDMDNIANIGRQRDRELKVARARRAQPIAERMQIVVYLSASDAPIMIRYTDANKAIKDFDRLLKAADKGEAIALSSPAMTMAFRFPQNIVVAYLIDVETNNNLMVDTQRRMNAAMQLP